MNRAEFRERIRTSLANPTLQIALDANAERRGQGRPARAGIPAQLAGKTPASPRHPCGGDTSISKNIWINLSVMQKKTGSLFIAQKMRPKR